MIPSLNGIRAISVLIVLFSHAGFGNIIPGGFGVTTFFFLSGFLITTLLIEEYNKKQKINFKHFFVRRFLRLIPPLIVTLLIVYALTFFNISSGSISLKGILSQLLYLTNYAEIYLSPLNIPSGMGVLWSLAVEEHYYLIYPFLLALLLNKTTLKKFTLVILFICITVLLWRIKLVMSLESNRIYYATDTRIDSIMYGCLLALFLAQNKFSDCARSMSALNYSVLASSLGILFFTFLYRDPTFRETFRYSLQGIALIPLFYLAIKKHKHIFFKLLNTNLASKLGIYSYSIYLIHYFLIKLLQYHN